MENLRYRKDNKKLLIWAYIAFAAIIISSLIVNILNTKNVINMYILLAVFATSVLLYLVFYMIYVRRNKAPLQLEDNYLAFYVSFNRNNKKINVIN